MIHVFFRVRLLSLARPTSFNVFDVDKETHTRFSDELHTKHANLKPFRAIICNGQIVTFKRVFIGS